MGRTYMVDSSVQITLNRLIETSGTDWSIGLVIGQFSPQRDYVVHVASTPKFEPPSTVETTEDSSSGDGTKITTMKSSESRNSLALGKTLDTLNEKQMTNHARQANRMLTGGLDILGIFVIARPDDLKTAQPKLRQVVYAVHKYLSKSESRLNATCHNDRILLHLCPLSKKYTCRTFDVSDSKSSGNPAEWKIIKTSETFTEVTAKSYSLFTVIPVQNESLSTNLQRQTITGLSPLFRNINNSVAAVSGRIITEESAPLSGSSDQPKTKNKKQQSENTSDQITLDLLYNTFNGSCLKPSVIDCGAKMVIKGAIATRAFVHGKSTIGDAVTALKADIIRSITARCELMCEDLLSAEEDQDPSVVYETPTRVFVSLPGLTSIKFCDYLFQDETTENSAERFKELLGIDVDEDDIDPSKERIPDESELDFPELSLGKESTSKDPMVALNTPASQSSGSVSLYHILVVVVVLLAMLVGVFLFPS